jgi:alkanesulfonate monooxygenase SsuD/methylene tetrahydromethanopterin reductase-like flavin-dependent oxidoreductase (luciferase family)
MGKLEFGTYDNFAVYEVQTSPVAADVYEQHIQEVQPTEELGYSQYFIIEHQNSDVGQITAPSVYLGAVAQRTSRIRFGTMIYQLPFYNLIRIAEEAAIVDHISEDRLVFGVGRSSFLESYQGYNIDYGESRGRFAESLEIILKAWGDEPLSYEGEFYQFHDVNLVPKPYQKPHPPVRVAVESVDTFALTGSLGFPIFIRHQMPIPQLQEILQQHRDARRLAGFSGPNDVILQIGAYVAETPEEAYS